MQAVSGAVYFAKFYGRWVRSDKQPFGQSRLRHKFTLRLPQPHIKIPRALATVTKVFYKDMNGSYENEERYTVPIIKIKIMMNIKFIK